MIEVLRNNFFNKEPVIKNRYLVKDHNEIIAILSDPCMSDQFWFDFILTPLSFDEAVLVGVYDYNRWFNQEYTIVEADTSRIVEFFINVEFDDEKEVFEPIDLLKNRPMYIRLRGPYAIKKP